MVQDRNNYVKKTYYLAEFKNRLYIKQNFIKSCMLFLYKLNLMTDLLCEVFSSREPYSTTDTMETEILKYVNEDRKEHGLTPLTDECHGILSCCKTQSGYGNRKGQIRS